MHIAIIQPRVSYYVGGSEKTTLRHIEVFSKYKDNNVTLYTTKPIDNIYSKLFKEFKLRNKNVNIIELPIPTEYHFIYDELPETNQSRWDRESILFSILVRDLIKNDNVSVVLSYYLVDSVFRNLNIPNVVYLGGHPMQEIEIYNAFLTFCDATISNSKNVYELWVKKIQKNGVKQNYILPKGSDCPQNPNRVFMKGVNIVFAGRLIQGKGVENLLASFVKILPLFPDAHLWILGEGREKDFLIKLSEELNIGKCVTFCGHVDNVQDYFYSSTLCVFPSVYREGLMTVVAEAMSVGACIISSSNMGNEELIKNGISGILIEPDNIDLLTKSMIDILQNDLKRKDMGNAAREFAVNNLSWAKVGERLNEILINVCSGRK